MGVFSKHHRYREAGKSANAVNVAQYGQPVRSLFTSTKVFTLHHRMEVTDAQENVVYRAQSKLVSLHDSTKVTDAQGNPVASIRRKMISLHERHFITMADGLEFEMSNEILHIIRDVTNIQGLDWQLRGNILALNFQIVDSDGSIIALISQKMISLHDKYCIDIYKPEYEQIAVTILIALQHMMRDREKAANASNYDE